MFLFFKTPVLAHRFRCLNLGSREIAPNVLGLDVSELNIGCFPQHCGALLDRQLEPWKVKTTTLWLEKPGKKIVVKICC